MPKTPDDVFAYDCPSQGIDFDISPPPPYGSTIQCSACDGTHIADEKLGDVTRYFEDGDPLDLTDEWKRGSLTSPAPEQS